MGILDRLKSRLGRTRDAISDGISGLFRGGRAIDQALLDELEELLYTSDLGPTASVVCDSLQRLHKRHRASQFRFRGLKPQFEGTYLGRVFAASRGAEAIEFLLFRAHGVGVRGIAYAHIGEFGFGFLKTSL